MGRSVSSTPSSPDAMILQILDLAKNLVLLGSAERVSFFKEACSLKIAYGLFYIIGQALDLLVSVSYIRYRTSTSDLSTLCSSRGLTSLCYGKSHLEGGFTLRCFQRLSLPDLATQPCSWRNNWCTRGQSIPVLSY